MCVYIYNIYIYTYIQMILYVYKNINKYLCKSIINNCTKKIFEATN